MKIESSEREVITSQDLQNAYIKFYPFMMKFLWDIDTVMHLANLEISIYKRFVDIDEITRNMNLIESDIRETYKDDPEFKKAFDYLKDCVDIYEESGYDIYRVAENINVEDILNPETNSSEKTSKEISVGKIVKK